MSEHNARWIAKRMLKHYTFRCRKNDVKPTKTLDEFLTEVEAAKAAMGELAVLFVSAATSGTLRAPLVRDVSPALAACAHDKHPELDGVVPPESFQAMLQAWA